MKSRLKYLFLVIFVFSIFVYLFKERSPFGDRNTSFSTTQGNEITRIEMYQGENKLLLTKNGDMWLVNKVYEARKTAIRSLLGILEGIRIKSPVSSEIFRTEIIGKQVDPVRINVYSRRRLIKSFFVYRTDSNIYGNIMKMRPSAKPFIVYLPGREDDIGSFFTLNELYWKPFSVFHMLPGEINSVSVKYLADTASSFTIIKKGGEFIFSGIPGNTGVWDSVRVRRYVSYFTSVPFESWALDIAGQEKESILKSKPLCIITVTGKDRNTNTKLTVWDKIDNTDGERVRDDDRIYGRKDEESELFIMRYFDLDPVLKKKSYFFGN